MRITEPDSLAVFNGLMPPTARGMVATTFSRPQNSGRRSFISWRIEKNTTQSPGLVSGIAFFTFLRDLTLGGYFTSEIGMKSLPYLGNQFVAVFPGCPPVPQS